MKIKICLLIGLPAVGKTTLAERVKQNLGEQSTTHVILLSYDKFIPEDVYNDSMQNDKYQTDCFFGTSWKGYRNNVLEFIQNIVLYLKGTPSSKPLFTDHSKHLDDICSCVTQNPPVHECLHLTQNPPFHECLHLILVDDNMFYRSMRYCYYQLARNNGCNFCQLFLDGNLEVILARNESRDYNRTVTKDTILKMADLIEKPDAMKYHWEKNSLCFSTDSVTGGHDLSAITDESKLNLLQGESGEFEALCKFLSEHDEHLIPAIEDHVDESQREDDRQLCLKNVLHNGDQIIRKYISRKMEAEKTKSTDKKGLKVLGKQLNGQRKSYLSMLKCSTAFCLYFSSDEDVSSEEFKELVTKGFDGFLISNHDLNS